MPMPLVKLDVMNFCAKASYGNTGSFAFWFNEVRDIGPLKNKELVVNPLELGMFSRFVMMVLS